MAPAITLAADAPTLSAANTGFMLICTALVMLMTPGLAFFYGGMVRVKSTLNMLMMSFISLGIVTVLWVLYGFSVAFGDDKGSLVGWNSDWVGLSDIGLTELWDGYTIPVFVFLVFQLMFAVLTPALISGALADRVKFTAWALFIALWATVVYFPVAHWVWGAGGWAFELGVIDFAGGTAVHINAGAAALGVILVIGTRHRLQEGTDAPARSPLVDASANTTASWSAHAGAWRRQRDRDPALPIDAAAAAAQAGLPLSLHAARRMATGARPLPTPWPAEAREQLGALLGSGRPTVDVWEALAGRRPHQPAAPRLGPRPRPPQLNGVHRRTVDRHLIETAVRASEFTRRVRRPDLLLVAALLHDIGKGRPGDHSEAYDFIARDGAARTASTPTTSP
ncbi:Bifunctional uridylyltransferase/uridylyl-removing enzyme [Streptomyces griseoloalbus]